MLADRLLDNSALEPRMAAAPAKDLRDYLRPAPGRLQDHVPPDFRAALRAMALAVCEAKEKAKLSPSDNGDMLIAWRWARHVAEAEDFEVTPGPVLTIKIGDLNVVGPSRKGSHRLAGILWRCRQYLSPENRPSAPPRTYVPLD